MGHQHSHAPTGSGTDVRRRLAIVLGLALPVLVVQVVAGLLSGSVALLADAAHVATDAGGVGLALFAATMATRPASLRRTFGWQRLEVLAAAVNAAVLLALAGWILVEAVSRLADPHAVLTGPMLLAATFGLVANAAAIFVLRGAGTDSLNVRGAYLEVLADAVGSAAVIAAALLLRAGVTRADAIAGIAIAVFIVPRTLRLLREAVDVLLEATPRSVDLGEVRVHLLEVPGVVDVHDLHAWTITSGRPVLSAHLVVDELSMSSGGVVLDTLSACLAGHFDVEHCTFQLEPVGHAAHETHCLELA